ncbi:hypothetical protein KCU93_g5306, partial [Aureobasidium melanogenum]
MSVEADTITYRFVEARTQKSYTFVLKAETPSHEIKLEAKWLFSDISTRSLVEDIYLNLHADSCGSENFAWSFSWLEIKQDQNDAKLLLTNRSNEAKRKPGSSTPWKNTILGNDDILEFRCDFPKPPEGFSKHVGTCVFNITIERSRHLPTELEYLLQNEARFEPPRDNTHRAWRVACEQLDGRPLHQGADSNASAAEISRCADQDLPSQTSQDEDTLEESNEPDSTPTNSDEEVSTHGQAAHGSDTELNDLEPVDEARRHEAFRTYKRRLSRSWEASFACGRQVRQLRMRLEQNASSQQRLAREVPNENLLSVDDALKEYRKTIEVLQRRLIEDSGYGRDRCRTDLQEAAAKLDRLLKDQTSGIEKLVAEKKEEQREIETSLEQGLERQTQLSVDRDACFAKARELSDGT